MNPGETRAFGKAKAWHKDGIHVLHLRGTMAEMAAQHGALLKAEIQQGAIPYLGQKNNHLLERSHLFKDRPAAAKLAKKLIHILIHKPMLSHVPRHYIEEARALARAADIPYDYVKEAMCQADTLVLMLRFLLGKHVLGQLAGGFPGCTSVVATGKSTASGGVMHARNMDYPVVGRWDAFPTVFYADPEGIDKGMRYIGVGTAGLTIPGVTSLNEAGLSLAAHFHCAKAVSVFGTPIQFIGSEIVRNARTIGQAVDIARDHERAGSWSIVVTSAKENDAAVIEMIHGKISVRHPDEDGHLAHSNHFRTPEFQELEVLLSASVASDYLHRYNRALELLKQSHGQHDRGTMARILGDHFDRDTKRVRSHATTISVVTTVTSMITEAALGKFWVANPDRSPTCLGDYSGFRIDENFEGFGERAPELFAWTTAGATTIRGTPKEEAFKLFREAYKAFHTDYDDASAAEWAERAAKADGEEGHYHMAHGHFRMRLGRPDRALEAFLAAAGCVLSPHMLQVAKLFRGQALDCLGRREEALEQYKLVLDAIDPHVRDEAKRCMKRPYSTERAMKMTFDLQFCDSFEYA